MDYQLGRVIELTALFGECRNRSILPASKVLDVERRRFQLDHTVQPDVEGLFQILRSELESVLLQGLDLIAELIRMGAAV